MKHQSRIRNITGLALGLQLLALLFLSGATSRLAAAEPLQWIGNTFHWPGNGELDSGDDLWIDCETWPAGSASTVDVVYTFDGGTSWLGVALGYNGPADANDSWHVNLGGFPAGGSIEYAVVARDAVGNELWDNNGGSDYTALVALPQIAHTPDNASLTRHDDLVIVFDAPGAGSGYASVEVIYSFDGTNWLSAPMERTPQAEYDHWEANLGKFLGDIEYALVATDAEGNEHRLDDAGANYVAFVGDTWENQVPLLYERSSAATASGSINDKWIDFEPWLAFDGDIGRMWGQHQHSEGSPVWLAYDFGQATRIDAYTLVAGVPDYPPYIKLSYPPRDFELQGSNGSGWVTLDSRVGEAHWARLERRYYRVSSPGDYQSYRLLATEDHLDGAGVDAVRIAEFELLRQLDLLIAQTPEAGSLTSQDDLVITLDGAGSHVGYSLVEVVYTVDGTTWLNAPLSLTTHSGYDHWEANLGKFFGGTTVRYALVATDAAGNQTWFNNSGDDYATQLAPPTVVSTPANGSLTSQDDLVVGFDAQGAERGFTQVDLEFQYSQDPGNWHSVPMVLTAGVDVDHWVANLGKFLDTTVVHYALLATDTEGNQHRLDNGGADFIAEVNGEWVNQVPTLSGPDPRATASSEYASTYGAWRAFDGTQSAWRSSSSSDAWVAYEFAQPTPIARYTVTGNYTVGSYWGTSYDPRDFELQGSNGGAWVTLDRRAGETGWRDDSERSYVLSVPAEYQAYRLLITVAVGGSNKAVRELALEQRVEVKIGHSPANGSLTFQDDLVISFDGAGSHVGYSLVEVVYSSDGGTNWRVAALELTGQHTGYDHWEVNLGTFAAGSSIQYALVSTDAEGNQEWFNNGGADYTATVAP